MNRRTYLGGAAAVTAGAAGIAGYTAFADRDVRGPDTGSDEVTLGDGRRTHSRAWHVDVDGVYVEQVIHVEERDGLPDGDLRIDLFALFVAVSDGGDAERSCLDGGAIDSCEVTVSPDADVHLVAPHPESVDFHGSVASDPEALLESYPGAFDGRADLSDDGAVYDALAEIDTDVNRFGFVPTVRRALEGARLEAGRPSCPLDALASLGTIGVGLEKSRDRLDEPSGEAGNERTTYRLDSRDGAVAVAFGYAERIGFRAAGPVGTIDVATELASSGSIRGSDLPADGYRHETSVEL